LFFQFICHLTNHPFVTFHYYKQTICGVFSKVIYSDISKKLMGIVFLDVKLILTSFLQICLNLSLFSIYIYITNAHLFANAKCEGIISQRVWVQNVWNILFEEIGCTLIFCFILITTHWKRCLIRKWPQLSFQYFDGVR